MDLPDEISLPTFAEVRRMQGPPPVRTGIKTGGDGARMWVCFARSRLFPRQVSVCRTVAGSQRHADCGWYELRKVD